MNGFIRFYYWMLLRRYDVKVEGEEILDHGIPYLFLPNHPAGVDPQLLICEISKKVVVSPMVSESYYKLPLVNYFMKKMEAVSISDLEKGVRDISVLDKIKDGAKEAFTKGNSVIIYPGGQLCDNGYESIKNKQGAYVLVRELDDNVRVIGVKISGLWGSMWSRAWTGASPSFFKTFMKSVFYVFANFFFFCPKREVEICFFDITETAKQKAQILNRRDFNLYLEEFYNSNGEEKLLFLKHHFLSPKLNRELPLKKKA